MVARCSRNPAKRMGRLTLVLVAVIASGLAPLLGQEGKRESGDESIIKVLGITLAKLPVTKEVAHALLYSETGYPSARQCRECHQNIYDEWASSAHAYAAISPIFHKFDQKINELASGTVGAFCVRCHIPVGSALGEPRELPLWERARVSTEGVTCVVCHRIDEESGKVNAERRILPGKIFDPVYGSQGAPGLIDVLKNAEKYNVTPEEGKAGIPIHSTAKKLEQLSKADFCAPCHQVAVHPGIKLEVVWDQYRASPAYDQGIKCQDCHMGAVPGTAKYGYPTASRATINGIGISPGSKHTDHSMVGPGYSIAHPGIFPHHPDSHLIPIKEWLTFNWRAGWGTVEFEQKYQDELPPGVPPEWAVAGRRKDARKIVEENLATLDKRIKRRRLVMEIGSRIDGPFFSGPPGVGKQLSFSYKVSNTDDGHNLPSGSLGAQPEIWLNAALIDPDGKKVWESGYVDSDGDMADLHSKDVLAGKLPHDAQLFNLQTKFLTTNVKGTDREMFLPINVDIDQRPFIRPAGQPVTVMNHPPFIRMEQRSIPPLGSKTASYTAPAAALGKPGTYKLAVRLRSRAEPIYFMRFVGATEEMVRGMNTRMIDIHPYTVAFEVK